MRMVLITVVVFILVVFAGVSGLMFTPFFLSSDESTGSFGDDTVLNINAGNYSLACSDAEFLATIFTDNDFQMADLLAKGIQEGDVTALLSYSSFNSIMKQLEVSAMKDRLPEFTDQELIVIEDSLKEDVKAILEAVYVTMSEEITFEELDEYIDSEFCSPSHIESSSERMQSI